MLVQIASVCLAVFEEVVVAREMAIIGRGELPLSLSLSLPLPLALPLAMIGVSITRPNAWGRSLDELKRGADRIPVPVPVLLLVLVLLVVLRLRDRSRSGGRGRSRGMVGREPPYHRYRPSRGSKMNHTPLSPSPFLCPWA